MSNHLGLSDSVLTNVAITPRNASGSAANSAAIDMKGWEGIRFVVQVGVLGTNGTADFAVYRDDNSGFNSGTLCTDADTNANAVLTQVVNANTVHIIDVFRPRERYVRGVATGHTNGAFVSVTYDLYRRQGTLPPTQAGAAYVKIREQ